jgi:hypothetical protein
MVWLKQPNPFVNGPWQEQVLFQGPDVWFVLNDVDGDGKMEFITTQYFSSQVGLILYWCNSDTWLDCANSKTVQSRVIDSTIGTAFYVVVSDVNGDGKDELLVTNNNNKNGGVFAYEIPANPKSSSTVWPKHTLCDGFKPLHPLLPGSGAPGNLALLKGSGLKPNIVVSGDDNGNLVLLTPASSTNTTDWKYLRSTLYQATGTTGIFFCIKSRFVSSQISLVFS